MQFSHGGSESAIESACSSKDRCVCVCLMIDDQWSTMHPKNCITTLSNYQLLSPIDSRLWCKQSVVSPKCDCWMTLTSSSQPLLAPTTLSHVPEWICCWILLQFTFTNMCMQIFQWWELPNNWSCERVRRFAFPFFCLWMALYIYIYIQTTDWQDREISCFDKFMHFSSL